MGAIYEDELKNAICTTLNKLAWAEERDTSVFTQTTAADELAQIEKGLMQIQRRKELLHDRALAEKYTPELRAKKAALDAEERALLEKKERLNATTNTDALQERIRQRGIQTAFSKEDEAFITDFVETVTVWTGDRIEVRFTNGIVLTEPLKAAEPTMGSSLDAKERSAS